MRAGWELRLGRPERAVAEAEIALVELLHEGLSVEEFVRLSLLGAQAEGLFRFKRAAVARSRPLHDPLTLRWEALRRAGRRAEARQMRALCIRHFSERASVWVSAGDRALDENDLDSADGYYERCLSLDAHWAPALTGKAIVLERRKDWDAALHYRRRVTGGRAERRARTQRQPEFAACAELRGGAGPARSGIFLGALAGRALLPAVVRVPAAPRQRVLHDRLTGGRHALA